MAPKKAPQAKAGGKRAASKDAMPPPAAKKGSAPTPKALEDAKEDDIKVVDPSKPLNRSKVSAMPLP